MTRAAVAFVEFEGDFAKISKGVDGEAHKLEDRFHLSFKKIAAFGAASLLAIGTGLVGLGEKFDGAFNTIARGTGATGKTLAGLDKSFKNVLASGSGTFDQVSAAVTTLYQRTRLTGKGLEDFAAKQVTLARITKTDVAQNLQTTTALFNLYGVAVGRQSSELDVLFHASQIAGVTITQLASDMQSAAPTAKILGLSIDQTASIVAQLDRAGLPASRVMQGLAGAFSKAAKAGKDPLTVIRDLVAEVKKAPNATVAAEIAVKKFGIGARQASVLVAGLRSGTIDLTKSLDGGKGILATADATSTLSGVFAHLKNVVLVGLEPLATRALGAVTDGVRLLTPLFLSLSNGLGTFSDALISKFSEPAKHAFELVVLAWDGVRAGFAHPDAALAGFGPVAKFFIGFGQIVFRSIQVVRTVLSGFAADFSKVVHSKTFLTVIGFLVTGFFYLRDIAVGVFDQIRSIVSKVGPPVAAFLDRLGHVFSSNIGARIAITALALAALSAGIAAIASPAILSVAASVSSVLQGLQVAFGALTSPLGLTIFGVALLAAGFFILYQRSATFRDVVAQIGRVFRTEVLPALKETAAWLREHLAAAFDEVEAAVKRISFRDVFRDTIGAVEAARTAIEKTVNKIVGFFQSHAKDFSAIANQLVGVWRQLAPTLRATFTAVVNVLRVALIIVVAVTRIVVAILTDLWDRFGHQLLDHLRIAFNAIAMIVKGALQIVQGIMEVITGILTLKWAKVWQGIQDIFGGVWTVIVGVLKAALNELSTLIGLGMALISAVWDAGWHLLQRIVSGVFDAVLGFVKRWWPLLLAPITGGLSLVVALFIGHFGQIRSFVSGVISDVVGFFRSLPGRILSTVGKIASAALAIGKAIINGIVSGVSGAIGKVGDIGKSIANAAINFINSKVIGGIRAGIRLLANALANVNAPIVGKAFDAASSLLNNVARSFPTIPTLDTGGVVTRPTVALLAANSKPEIVTPTATLRRIFADVLGEKNAGATVDARTIVQGNVYGDGHLKSLFTDHDRKLELELAAG